MNQRVFRIILTTALVVGGALRSLQAAEVTADQFVAKDHPRVYATVQERAAVWEKIQTNAWAKKIYDDLKAEVDPLVERHVTDPQWICSRLQMHWEEGKHFTDFHCTDHQTPRREGNAPFPTVRVAIGHQAGGGGTPLEKVEPYGNGRLWTKVDDKWSYLPFEETKLGSELVNERILNHAYQAAIVYYFTGDRKYAKFAADIIWTVIRGASYQNQLNPNEEYNRHGYLSFETLGDSRRYATLALTYDFIHDYLVNEYFELPEFKAGRPGERWAPAQPGGKAWALERVEIMFKKFLDNKLTRGGGIEGNWNLNEHRSGILYAMALDDDSAYKDGKGREYYVTQFLYGPTTKGNGAYVDVAKANINPETGLWREAPGGYGQGSLEQMVTFGHLYWHAGINVLGNDPLIFKGAASFPQVAFPNGRSTAWGDAGYLPMFTEQAELMIAFARAKGDAALEDKFTALLDAAGGRNFKGWYYSPLFFYVPSLKPVSVRPPYPRVSYDPVCSIVFERNLGDSPTNSLMYTVYGYGEKSGHRHANGMAMELYGRGHILGVDPGAGQDYWNAQHTQYNSQVAAHNCVIPNGVPAEMGRAQPLQILNAEPEIKPGVDPDRQLSPNFQFSDTFNDYNTGKLRADQRRVMGIVRTGTNTGYYVDVFRSKVRDGEDTHHDYLYHNMGTSLTLPFSTTEAKVDGPGYNWFKEVRSAAWTNDFCGVFDFGIASIKMTAWFLGGAGRTIYSASGPPNFRYYLEALKEKRVPTLIVRQDGEAWTRPFIAVYEPYSSIKRVRRMPGDGFVGIAVEHDSTDYILNATDAEQEHVSEGIRFKGIYGVVRKNGGQITELYLGRGQKLGTAEVFITAAAPVSASLVRQANGWRYSASTPVKFGFVAVKQPAVFCDDQRIKTEFNGTNVTCLLPAGYDRVLELR